MHHSATGSLPNQASEETPDRYWKRRALTRTTAHLEYGCEWGRVPFNLTSCFGATSLQSSEALYRIPPEHQTTVFRSTSRSQGGPNAEQKTEEDEERVLVSE